MQLINSKIKSSFKSDKTPNIGSKISRCMVISGNIKSCEPVTLDGRVVGDIYSDDIVYIQRGAFVVGSIRAKEVVVDGILEGPIEANVVLIEKNGVLEGYIIANSITIKGRSDGEILAKETLFIDKEAVVQAYEARAKYITIYGKVVGDVVAIDSVDIKRDGVVEGTILTKELKTQVGSKIYGSISRYKDSNKYSSNKKQKSENKVIRKIKRF